MDEPPHLKADAVCRCLFLFAQRIFREARQATKDRLIVSAAEPVFTRLERGTPLSAAEVCAMPPEQRRIVQEILSQYIIFFTSFADLKFPLGFLSGSSADELGPAVLAYICEHRWPFPQLLPQ
jgi:hypothetical protein